MSVWRCLVCKGVNQGGRRCKASGAVMLRGKPLRVAVRSRLPSAGEPPPPPVPPTPRARELRELPSPDELRRLDPDDLLTFDSGFRMVPLLGGCLVERMLSCRPIRRLRLDRIRAAGTSHYDLGIPRDIC
jgi:hypothetical protein